MPAARSDAILIAYRKPLTRKDSMDDDRPAGVLIPTARQSNPLRGFLRKVDRDGRWHRVGERMGGSTAEQYARRLNMSQDVTGTDVAWVFGYKDLGDFSELWAKWVGPR